MMIRNPRDFWAGILYLTLGIGVVLIGRNYSFGSSARMGPGYFPIVLGSILTVLGFIAVIRSFFRDGEPISAFAWKPVALVLGATVLFGLLLPRLGLLIALPLMIAISITASRNARPDLPTLGLIVGLVVFSALVFVKGLGLPMPLIGNWLGG